MDKAKLKTTIEIPEGRILTQAEFDAIQKILDSGVEPPVDPPVDNNCEAGPVPQTIIVVDDSTLQVFWYGKGVTPLKWEVRDLLGNLNGSDIVVPKPEDRGTLIVKLSSPLKSSPKYKVILSGVDCNGTGEKEFDNPYYNAGPVIEDCKEGPEPKTIKKVGDKKIELGWHGVKVEELDWVYQNSAGKLGGKGTIKPSGNVLTLTLDDTLSESEKITVVLSGKSCKGAGALVASNPFFVDAGCCDGQLTIDSVKLTKKDE